jgi:multiple sugar transport system substrate-binding protein
VFIPKKASRPDMSWDFVKRITTLETELAATEEAGMLMPRKSWAEDEKVQGDPKIKAFAEGLTYAEEFRAGTYQTGKAGELGDLYKKLYETVILEGTPVEQAYESYLAAASKLVKG